MFCDNCGFKLDDGATFCDHCGARVTPENASANNSNTQNNGSGNTIKFSGNYSNANNNYSGNNYVNNDNNYQQQTQSEYTDIPNPVTPIHENKKSKKPVIIAASALCVVLAATAAFASKPVRNSINKTFMSSEKYFNHVVDKKTSDSVEEVSSFLTNLSSPNFGAEGNIRLEAGEALHDLIDEYGGTDASDYISWFENGTIKYNIATTKNAFSTDLGLNINDTDLIDASIVMDAEEGYGYITVPQISKTAIRAEFDPTEYLEATSQMSESMGQLEELLKVLPDQKVTEKLLNKYVECVVDSVDDIDESTKKIKIEDVSVKTTVLTANIDGETFANILKNVLTEVKDDKEIKKIITDLSELEISEGSGLDYDSFVEEIDAILEAGFEDIEESEFTFALDFYVNNKGEIIGFGFEEEGVEFLCASIVKGKKFASTLSVTAEGMEYELSGSGKISGNKKTGEYNISVTGIDIIKITLTGVDTKKLEDGKLVGTVAIEPGAGITTFTAMADSDVSALISDLKLEIKGTDKDAKLSLYSGEDLYIALGFEGKTTDKSKVTIPSDYIDSENANDMMDWGKDAEGYITGDFIDNLKKINVPDEIIDELKF